MTPFELIVRSVREHMKQDYLYVFSLISSTTLYFVFAVLQHDSSEIAAVFGDVQFVLLIRVSGILLLAIVALFTIYANSIFLRRRSREIGLYQLAGMTRRQVGSLLMTEHVMLGLVALLIGMGMGTLVSRLFLLILMKLIGIENGVAVSFSTSAALQTAIAFIVLNGMTCIQILYKIRRVSLLDMLRAERLGDQPRQPSARWSVLLGILSIVLIAMGYIWSGIMPYQSLMLHTLIILVSIILGTYLLFRVTLGRLFYQIRRRRNGQLGLKNSLSLAPLMHRMRANACSLTIITVLSAVTLTMLAVAYSLYYSAESESRAMLPFDFVFENQVQDAQTFRASLEQAGIPYVHHPVKALRVTGQLNGEEGQTMLLLAAEHLHASSVDIRMPKLGEAVWYKGQRRGDRGLDQEDSQHPIELVVRETRVPIPIARSVDRYAMNFNLNGNQLVVREATLQAMISQISNRSRGESKWIPIDTFRILVNRDRAAASYLYKPYVHSIGGNQDFYSYSQTSHQKFGLVIFVAGFLGLIFLITTGSILYFKQMAEAEQERNSYRILRQLGFEEHEILGGIIRKQLIVFGIPLAIGLTHSIFAVRAFSAWTLSDIVFPAAIAMSIYTIIYLIFAVLAYGYYRRIVRLALQNSPMY
ncbi:FtsX-like permease family protein [Paenibacillus guangzhouensis]|uniref:FtsX-like permease family protein n=1 Tax=Paenibacillus guangzhouensis TaxID=1473112 RepID=UPI0012673045|nr:ABC transporter permease [Paenibacillus guangzhouensis]